MGGTADGGQRAPQELPEDLMTVREAAQAVGVAPQAVQSWITRGRLTAYAPSQPQGRRVSLAAVRALSAPQDPQTPAEAVLVAVAAPMGDCAEGASGSGCGGACSRAGRVTTACWSAPPMCAPWPSSGADCPLMPRPRCA